MDGCDPTHSPSTHIYTSTTACTHQDLYNHPPTHSHPHPHQHTPNHPPTPPLPHTHTHTHTHPHTHTHTHTRLHRKSFSSMFSSIFFFFLLFDYVEIINKIFIDINNFLFLSDTTEPRITKY